MKVTRLVAALCVCFSLTLSAQDIHFTLFNMSPTWLNPALTGAFEGTARIGGLYRGQWYTLDGIQTPSFYLDAPIIRGFREQDWVGVGLTFIQDNAGPLDLTTGQQALGLSYHLALDKNRNNIITLGGQYVRTSLKLSPDGGTLTEETIEDRLGGGGLNAGTELNGMELTTDYTDFAGGIMLRSRLAETNLLEVGVALQHITMPENRLLTGGSGSNPDAGERPSTLHAHATLDYGLNDKWRLMPTAFFQSSAGNSATSIQAWVGRQINPDFLLKFGLGYRTADAGKFLFGVNYKDLRASLAYDLTLSQARTINSSQGAFEIAAYYIIKLYKKPEITPTILCPRI